MASHAFGCACSSHTARPWRRPEHWSRDEVEYLEKWYGRRTDEAIGHHLGRPEVGVFLKAKRLGLHKRAAGFTGREVHRLTGRMNHPVARMIAAGLIRGRRRGTHWYVPVADLPRIRALSPDAIDDSVFRRRSVLEVRRNRRKGVHARSAA